jgi:hypothetical protein
MRIGPDHPDYARFHQAWLKEDRPARLYYGGQYYLVVMDNGTRYFIFENKRQQHDRSSLPR